MSASEPRVWKSLFWNGEVWLCQNWKCWYFQACFLEVKNVELVVEKCLTGSGTRWQTYITDLIFLYECTSTNHFCCWNYRNTVSKTVLWVQISNWYKQEVWHFVSSRSDVQNWNAIEFVTSFLSTAELNKLRVHPVYQWNLIIFLHWVFWDWLTVKTQNYLIYLKYGL